jgi:hypothetical protein
LDNFSGPAGSAAGFFFLSGKNDNTIEVRLLVEDFQLYHSRVGLSKKTDVE